MPDVDPVPLVAGLIMVTGVLPLIGTILLVARRIRTTGVTRRTDGSVAIPLVAGMTVLKSVLWST